MWTAILRFGAMPLAALAVGCAGSVERVEISTMPGGAPAVRVVLHVDDSVRERIRADSVAEIGTVGLLGDGVLHSLIYDAPAEQDIVLQFLAAGGRLNSIFDKMDRGDGTLGLLLNDPTLYEELKVLVVGANRSTVVRSLIQMVTPSEEE